MRPRLGLVFALAAMSALLVGCGSDPVEVPVVAGLRLDDAHNVLRDNGFENFDDVDAISDRQPFMDSNWAVVEQVPAAGERIDPDDTVTLRIAKPEDEGIRELLPAESPVLAEIRKADARRDAAAEADRREQERQARDDAADRAREERAYAERIDPAARLARSAITELEEFRDALAAGSETYGSVGPYVSSFSNTMDAYTNILDQRDPPESVGDQVAGLRDAAAAFTRAAQTLYSATGPDGPDSLRRFSDVYGAALTTYNDELQSLYRGTEIVPPLL